MNVACCYVVNDYVRLMFAIGVRGGSVNDGIGAGHGRFAVD